MKALIDGDIFQYEFGTATDSEYKPLAWPIVQARMDSRIRGICESVGAVTSQIYLTSDDKSNFRYDIATIQPYKGHRAAEKPYWYYKIRDFLINYRGAQEVTGQEADDALSIEQWKLLTTYISYEDKRSTVLESFIETYKEDGFYPHQGTVICSRDKDLHITPGWHYTWACGKQKEKELWWQDELGGLQCFYRQLLTGDSVDNIPGLYGVGLSSKLLSDINSMGDVCSMYGFVLKQYKLRFGSYAEQFLLENGRLLWMRREENQMWEPPKKYGS